MGFTVAEVIDVAQYGLSLAHCFVTLHSTVALTKFGSPGWFAPMPRSGSTLATAELPYQLTYTYYVYASDAPGLTPLKFEYLTFCLAEKPDCVVEAAYAHVKAERFAGLTLTRVG